jgi:hypothetical protein
MKEIQKKLSAAERARLKECTRIISEAFTSQFKAGEALLEVRDNELYREDFDTFEDYCNTTFQIERAHAYRLMSAFEIRQGIEKRSPAIAKLITSERQARELAGVPMDKRVPLLRDIFKSGDPVTADEIRSRAEGGFEEKPDSIAPNVSPVGDILSSEKEEKPHITQPTRQETKPAEKPGKPLHMLAIWDEINGLYGKALNRLDELNRLCRNPSTHSLLISGTKKIMGDLSQWREAVKKG